MRKDHLVIGMLAPVDAGKTTLSEAILYETGAIRKAGRVDHGDAFLDTQEMERERGITIFSKPAEFQMGDLGVTLLDTPGHADFSPEMERTLMVLDYAILIISGPDGVGGSARTIRRLLQHYRVPSFLFVNKMDQPGTDKDELLREIISVFGESCVDFSGDLTSEDRQEQIALADESLMESYLDGNPVSEEEIRSVISDGKIIPVYFGSALKMEGVPELLEGLEKWIRIPERGETFGARIYKITRDAQGNRLSWMKVTGGSLKVKQVLKGTARNGSPVPQETSGEWEQKADQLRIYSGSGYSLAQEVHAGEIVAVTGLDRTYAGEGLGSESREGETLLEPVLNVRVIPEERRPVREVLSALRTLEEEEPALQIRYREETGEITAGIMGEVQVEILKRLLEERFGMRVGFGAPRIIYRETIAAPVEGVGHFEPLRHYAEVHLLMEPGEPGSGMVFDTECPTDILAQHWQRLVMTHLEEKKFRGVLTGAELTDMKITLIAGRAHEKHTEGGDFRQATYRAVRQGLMMAENILLEPVYHYQLTIPAGCVGRAMSDMERMGGTIGSPESDGDRAVLTGEVPVSEFSGYQTSLTSYTKGKGQAVCSLAGYFPCHNAEEVIEASGYDPDADLENSAASVFCHHGAGELIPWNEVRSEMHLDTGWKEGCYWADGKWQSPDREEDKTEEAGGFRAEELRREKIRKKDSALSFQEREKKRQADETELKEIFERTFGAPKQSGDVPEFPGENKSGRIYDSSWRDYQRKKGPGRKGSLYTKEQVEKASRKRGGEKEYLLVDGYNIIFAWEPLRKLAEKSTDSARDTLMDILSNFQGYDGRTLILVFDAYKIKGGERKSFAWHNIHVVYTKEAETADAYIEKTVHDLAKKHRVYVATSDGLEQMIILGSGAIRISAGELLEQIETAGKSIREDYTEKNEVHVMRRLLDDADPEVMRKLKKTD